MDSLQFNKEVRSAIRSGDVNRVVSLLSAKPDQLNLVTPFGTWLHVASRVGNFEIVKRLVEMGADINAVGGTFDAAPLKTAASYGHADIVKYLISNGAVFDTSEPFRNPLVGAIYNGHLNIVQLLIQHGFDYTVKYTGDVMKGTDAIAYARDRGQSAIVEYLASLSERGRS
jgi:ankyrin repeat protein